MEKGNKMKLHELIEMAKNGEKFKCYLKSDASIIFSNDTLLSIGSFSNVHIMADWVLVKDLEIIKFVLDCKNHKPNEAMNSKVVGPSFDQWLKMSNKKWFIVATEIVE